MERGAELEPNFSGSGSDYYRAVLNNDALTDSSGRASQVAMTSHVNMLESRHGGSSSSSSSSGSSSRPVNVQQPHPVQLPELELDQLRIGCDPGLSARSGWGATAAVSAARSIVNTPVCSTGTLNNGPTAYDCSGFTTAAFRAAGISLPGPPLSSPRWGPPSPSVTCRPGTWSSGAAAEAPTTWPSTQAAA